MFRQFIYCLTHIMILLNEITNDFKLLQKQFTVSNSLLTKALVMIINTPGFSLTITWLSPLGKIYFLKCSSKLFLWDFLSAVKTK